MVAILLAAALVFAAGGAEGAGGGEKITLNVWASNNGPDKFIRKAGEEFPKKYPNITINYVHVELGDAAG